MSIKVVLGIGWYFPESVGGTEVYVAALGRDLRSMGFEVFVAAPFVGVALVRYVHEGLPVFRYPIPHDATKEEAREKVMPRFFLEYERFLKEVRPHIVSVHFTGWPMGNFHIEAAKNMGAKVAVTFHNPTQGYLCPRGTNMLWGKTVCDGLVRPLRCGTCFLQSKGIPRLTGATVCSLPRCFGKAMERRFPQSRLGTFFNVPGFVEHRLAQHRRLLANADALICLSEARKETLLRNGVDRDKVHLCRLGVSQPSRTGSRETGAGLVIGYVGRLDPIKGVHILVQAVKRMPRTPCIRLKIFSPSNMNDRYGRFLKSLAGNRREIEFCSAVSAEEKSRMYAEMDVLAVPSLCMEGGPRVLLEAMAHGVPVIGSNVSAISEYVEDGRNGLLFTPGKVVEIRRCLAALVKDPSLVSRLRQGIRTPRTTADIAGETAALYRRLLDTP